MQIDTSKISKTTVNGVLGLLIVTCLALLGSGGSIISPHIAGEIALVLAVLRAWVAYLQKDAL